ncbi:MAG: AAA family ATPase, partial [Lachnospiraceae bacterium]|nr:AAA family ATPase [Lachnospiraceae bacterium]
QLSRLLKGAADVNKSSSSSGNLVITGPRGNGKTTLAIDVVKALQKEKRIEGRKLAKVSGKKLNSKDIYDVFSKLKGGALIIEGAGGLADEMLVGLSLVMEGDTGGLLVILEDSAEEIERIFLKNKNFASKFDYTIDIPVFSNDELVNFGKAYAQEAGYAFDEFGVLALYDRIGSRQTIGHNVTVAEVKDIIDAAVEHAEKSTIGHMIARITGKNVDEDGNLLLKEEDF